MKSRQTVNERDRAFKYSAGAILVSALLALANGSTAGSASDERSWYAGAGGVASSLSPKGKSGSYYVSDESGAGGRFFLGKGLGAHSRLQLNYIYAGESGLSNTDAATDNRFPNAAIQYQVPSLSYDYLSGYYGDRWRLFGRLGMASVQSKAVNSRATVNSRDKVQVLLGGGIETRLSEMLRLRGIYEYVSSDVQQASLALAIQFGGMSFSGSSGVRSSYPATSVYTMPKASQVDVVPGVDLPVVSPVGDTVEDVCESTVQELELYYNAGSLDARSSGIEQLIMSLDQLTLEHAIQIEIDTHTDGRSSKTRNLKFSQQRAERLKSEIKDAYPHKNWKIVARWHGESESGGYLMSDEVRAEERRADIRVQCLD